MQQLVSVTCTLCGTQSNRILFSVGQQQQLVRCNSCGLVYVTPWREDQSFYTEDYFVVKNQYLKRSSEFDPIFKSMLSKVQRFKRAGKLLDVGCGPGLLLAKAREVGFDVMGVEISEWAADFARTELGLPVVTGEVEGHLFPPHSFDVIVVNHVLEHLADPNQTLRILHSWLKHDGILVVGVPNFGSPMAKIKKTAWSSLLPEQHRWHFTPRTLSRLLYKNGFQKVYVSFYNHSAQGPLFKKFVLSLINLAMLVFRGGEAILLIAERSHVEKQ